MSEEEFTTIQVRVKTRDELKKLGAMGEDYDDVIQTLLKERD